MQRILCFTVLFASSMSVLDAKPYSNYGFYSPYPPPPDQVIYDFAPVQVVGDDYSGHRSTRDSTWKDEFGAFLDGDREPTCEQLREMWHYARSLQQRAVRTRQGPAPAPGHEQSTSSHLPPFVAFSPLEESKMGGGDKNPSSSGTKKPHPQPKPPMPPRQANRRRMSTPQRPRPRPPKVSVPAPSKGEAKVVYGVVKTHAPSKTTMHVRDPAKEIYGLLKEKALQPESSGGSGGGRRVFGQVRQHAQPESRRPSYMDILEKELYGAREDEDGSADADDSFGSVKYELPPASENDIPQTSSFEKVRALIAAESDLNDDRATYEGNGPFDLIRERLMNASPSSPSASSKLRSKANRAFRRKSSKKTKQRNVSAMKILN